MALALSQVCAAWRAVALDCPEFWRHIRLSSASSLSKLAEISSRSKGGHISVAMDHRQPSPTRTITHQWSLLNSLTGHRERIHTLSVIAPIRVLDLLSSVLFRARHDWPHLRCLNIAQGYPSRTETAELWNIGVTDWRHLLPSLDRLSIVGVTPTLYDYELRLKELHVKESDYFTLARHSPTESDYGVRFTSYFREIQKLSIVSSPLPPHFNYGRPVDTTITSLTLSHLRSVDNPPGVLAHFLAMLRMPALEHLMIHHLHGHLQDEFLRWVAAANDPWPSLRHADFESLVLDAQVLRALESVDKLRIVDGDVNRILQILEADAGLCPKIDEIDAGDEVGVLQIPGRS